MGAFERFATQYVNIPWIWPRAKPLASTSLVLANLRAAVHQYIGLIVGTSEIGEYASVVRPGG